MISIILPTAVCVGEMVIYGFYCPEQIMYLLLMHVSYSTGAKGATRFKATKFIYHKYFIAIKLLGSVF